MRAWALGWAAVGAMAAARLTAIVLPSSCMLITDPGQFTIVPGTDAAPPPTCAPGDNPGACTSCLNAKCCASFSACQNSAACTDLLSCGSGDTSCEKDNASGKSDLTMLNACIDKECPICNQSGIGDPCGASAPMCAANLTCAGIWCTKSCAGDADCVGLYGDGQNSSGGQNRCALNAENSAVCFPGCAENTDCAAFPGTACLSDNASTNGSTNVCAEAGDGGT